MKIFEQDYLRLEAVAKMCELVDNYQKRLDGDWNTPEGKIPNNENVGEILGAIGKICSQLTSEFRWVTRFEIMWGSVQAWQFVCPFLEETLDGDTVEEQVYGDIWQNDIRFLQEKVEIWLDSGETEEDYPGLDEYDGEDMEDD